MKTVSLSVDGVPVTVPEGASLYDAIGGAGVSVPALCRLEGHPHLSACMVCVVEESPGGRIVPSCACPAHDGMVVITSSVRAVAARKAAVEFLLSEHSGDCRAPCARACPAGLDVMRTVRLFEAGDLHGALLATLETLPFPALMAASCAAYCEKVCRRAMLDSSIEIRKVHDRLAREFTAEQRAGMIGIGPAAGPVVVRGDGPAALSAAFYLMRAGVGTVLEGDFLKAARKTSVEVCRALEEEMAILALAGCGFSAAGAPDARVLELPLSPEEWLVPAKAVARGRQAAIELAASLTGAAAPKFERLFESRIGDLMNDEIAAMAPLGNTPVGIAAPRCLACGCAREHDCGLRHVATGVGADRARFPGRRVAVTRGRYVMGRGAIVFEPGKCIKCGICVRLSVRTPFPLAFMGRGFEVHVGGFERYAGGPAGAAGVFEGIAGQCPTGALFWEVPPHA